MNEKQFEFYSDEDLIGVLDTVTGKTFNSFEIVDLLNEQQATITHLEKVNGKNFAKRRLLEQDNLILRNENEQLRLELETHKHPLWSTREAERKVNKLADSLADEVKKNVLLNEEINQLRIENMRLKEKRW